MSTFPPKRSKNTSKITNLIRKLFICGAKKNERKGLHPYKSYKEIKLRSFKRSKKPTEKVVPEVDHNENKDQYKPVSATVLSSSTVDLLVPALKNFKEDVRGSR